jgi:hypothetical protein
MTGTQSGTDSGSTSSGPGDALGAFANAFRDMCIFGSFALENALAPGNAGGTIERFAPLLDSMLREISAFDALSKAASGAIDGHKMTPQAGAAGTADIAALLTQAYLLAAASGLRYLRRVAQTYGAHQSDILQSLLERISDSRAPDKERRALIDEIRTYLREIGDVSLQEARIFQAELEKISARVADSGAGTAESSEHRRRWKAKP